MRPAQPFRIAAAILMPALLLAACQAGPAARSPSVSLIRGAREPRLTGVDLMPYPKSVVLEPGSYQLVGEIAVSSRGPYSFRVAAAVDRLAARLRQATDGAIMLVEDPGVRAEDAPNPAHPVLELEWQRTIPLSPEVDESYTLSIGRQGVVLHAATDIGMIRGLATLSQLAVEATAAPDGGLSMPDLSIVDSPRFPWRGLLLDCVRHFMPVDTIKRVLRGMATVKLNVFHWHLTDDQGFRIESRVFPRLTSEASGGSFYNQDQVREIVRYADELGIRVVPEFDVPAHTSALLSAYPALGTGPGPYEVEKTFGVFDAVLDPTRDETYRAIEQFFREIAPLFPDEYVHIGGDENNGHAWGASASVRAFMAEHSIPDFVGLTRYFTGRVETILGSLGKRAVVWEEAWNGERDGSLVVQVWAEPDLIKAAVAAGQDVIRSQRFYLDLMFPAAYHYAVSPDAGTSQSDAPRQPHSPILGGEAAMWSELVSSENVDSRIWPRLAAIAERLWSPASLRDVADMYRRLGVTNSYLDAIGMRQKSGEREMLLTLSGGRESGSLQVFADVLEPLKGYRRISSERYTVSTPLTRLVDAIPPESEVARSFAELVDEALGGEVRSGTSSRVGVNRSGIPVLPVSTTSGNSESRSLREAALSTILVRLSVWRANDHALEQLLHSETALEELVPVSTNLTRVAAVGEDAAFRLLRKWRSEGASNGSRGSKTDWAEQAIEVLDEASRWNSAQVSIAVIAPVRRLVEAANLPAPPSP
ncbi:MAG TPA: family 20 glycosylhydrolase [Spirochaetia bacterium]|nr:family 20 glycosylhydrolase [Spirochaetia bacterium]